MVSCSKPSHIDRWAALIRYFPRVTVYDLSKSRWLVSPFPIVFLLVVVMLSLASFSSPYRLVVVEFPVERFLLCHIWLIAFYFSSNGPSIKKDDDALYQTKEQKTSEIDRPIVWSWHTIRAG